MATICGMRRRGYPAAAIRAFVDKIGVSKAYSVIDYALLESCVRDNLNENADRAMAVLRPLKIIIDNYPENKTEEIAIDVNPGKPEKGKRSVTFSREIFIEQDDFMLDPPPTVLWSERNLLLPRVFLLRSCFWREDCRHIL